jgi:hypothetical protein
MHLLSCYVVKVMLNMHIQYAHVPSNVSKFNCALWYARMYIKCDHNEKKKPCIYKILTAMCLLVLLHIEPVIYINYLRNIIFTKNNNSVCEIEKGGEYMLVDSMRESYALIMCFFVYNINASALNYLNFSLFLLLYNVNAIF